MDVMMQVLLEFPSESRESIACRPSNISPQRRFLNLREIAESLDERIDLLIPSVIAI